MVKRVTPGMAASHVPAFLDFSKWLPATCALSRSSASSCQQLARSPQLRATVMLRERRYLAAACALQYMPAFVCQPSRQRYLWSGIGYGSFCTKFIQAINRYRQITVGQAIWAWAPFKNCCMAAGRVLRPSVYFSF